MEDATDYLEAGEEMPANVHGVAPGVREEWNRLVRACRNAELRVEARLDDDLNEELLKWARELVEGGLIPEALRKAAELEKGVEQRREGATRWEV